MNTLLSFTLLIILFLSQTQAPRAEVVLVVHKNSDIVFLSNKQVIDIYMGRESTFPNGEKVVPLDQNVESPIRHEFYKKLVNKQVSEINAYWARLLFSGRATPPRPVENNESMLIMLQENKSFIGYIDLDDVSDHLKVINYVN
ncbi:MAG: hypothetical protein HRT92_04000 [Piscirickettsiaceae bacterium]|nr:hypothetical protein [Piscirickettsiaceae bacterium]